MFPTSYREELSAEQDDPTGVGIAIDGYLERVMGVSMEALMQSPVLGGERLLVERITAAELNAQCDIVRAEALSCLIVDELAKADKMLKKREKDMRSYASGLREARDDAMGPESNAEKIRRCEIILDGIKNVRSVLADVWELKTTHF